MATRADERKFHYIYKITRVDGSGKFYIGMHSTDDLDDGYFGSGQLLWKSIKKHGKEKHEKEILAFLPSRKELKDRERELVNEEILDDPLCMNLQLGGEGGGKFWSAPQQRNASVAGNKSPTRDHVTIAKKILQTKHERNSGNFFGGKHNAFLGKHHTAETKQKMSVAASTRVGAKNSQFGTCWVSNGAKTCKIKLEFLDEYLMNGYSRGRCT